MLLHHLTVYTHVLLLVSMVPRLVAAGGAEDGLATDVHELLVAGDLHSAGEGLVANVAHAGVLMDLPLVVDEAMSAGEHFLAYIACTSRQPPAWLSLPSIPMLRPK
jgi:hypothetical protein